MKERDYKGKWGYSFIEIIYMPRQQFANMWGKRFLDYSDSKFQRTLRQETPFLEKTFRKVMPRMETDNLCDLETYKGTQQGGYDEENQGGEL